jgi:hypothetical protein
MATIHFDQQTELAHRCSDGIDVTLMWAHGDAHHGFSTLEYEDGRLAA